MTPDIERVIEVIRETAAKEVMPRFKALSENDIREKKPGDLVTTADIEAEKYLETQLKLLIPGSLVVGEEATDADPARLQALLGEAPVWLIDPVDGTNNFAEGRPCFAVMAAYCVGGETLAAWIHDPVSDATIWAAAGEGAWEGEGAKPGTQRLRLPAKKKALAEMKGSLSKGRRRRLLKRHEEAKEGLPEAVRYRCVGREYMDLARGVLDFALYARLLKPWDHAPGVLIHNEAGGFNALAADAEPYHPAKGGTYEDTSLLMAPDGESWNKIRNLLQGGEP